MTAVVSSPKNLKPAKRYSKALMEMALDANAKHTEVQKELGFILNTVNENRDLKEFIQNPVISKKDKKEVLDKIFNGKVSASLLNFLFLLCENNRLNILDDIFSSFVLEINKMENTVDAIITSAVPLDDAQKERLISKLQNKIKTDKGNIKVNPEFQIDEAILGGIVVKINDTVIDLSSRKKFENLRSLKNIRTGAAER